MNFLVEKILLAGKDWTAEHTKMNNFPHLESKLNVNSDGHSLVVSSPAGASNIPHMLAFERAGLPLSKLKNVRYMVSM